jgi:type IV pilus assembly protein PilY1
LGSGFPAFADDTELFVADASQFQNTARPNILFIMDTSGSMQNEVITQNSYDPAFGYGGACDANRVYWRTGTGNPPACDTDRWFDRAALMCREAFNAFANGAGRYTDRMAQYDPNRDDRWERVNRNQKTRLVECEDDGGLHGDGSDPAEVFAQNGDDSQLWSNDPADELGWGQRPADRVYTVFDGNYLNWFYGPTSTSTRIQVVKDVATDLLSTVNGVNVGLMRFNFSQGGPVVYPMEDIATARAGMTTAINNLPASGWTPLSETLYEAGQYYRGGRVDYGNQEGPQFSVAGARDPGDPTIYNSPLEFGCQKNFVVLLTDGAPTQDVDAVGRITGLPGFNSLVGPACDGAGDGACLDDMAEYLFDADLDPSLPGKQNVVTYTIGFTVNLPLLASTAARGGGAYFTADDTASLSSALTNIVTSILDTQTTFTSPAVSVNSFNRTQNLNDLFITVFRASGDVHWPGNLKKYRLRASDGLILDANGNAAVNPGSGFFDQNSQSFWSAVTDGPDIALGGAANRIPDPAVRRIYTYLGNTLLTDASNEMAVTNGAVDDALLNIGNPGDPTRDSLIDFIRGIDVTDTDQDNVTNEPRYEMGDPLHAKPVSVIYGGTVANPDINDATIYFATNDGYLHAIDPVTGAEKWAFIPPEFVGDQVQLFLNDASPAKHYGIDGNLRVQMFADNDGVVEPAAGEKVYLYFGMRRGGTFYYGVDVTDPDAPRLMWKLDSVDLPGVGQTWSSPVPARINIQGAAQNAEKMVLIFGGGYDPSQDNYNGSTDAQGNAIYIVDSVSGALLWHASKNGSDLDLSKMDYSIPADIKAIDLDGNKFADRLYASDMGGQVWRFDVFNGQPAGTLMNGGVIAQVGGAPQAVPPISETRRFYYAPDVALVRDDNHSFIHVGIGSGHRARPNSVFTQDRFYALRDYDTFNTRTQASYDTTTPIVDGDLMDITNDVDAVVANGQPGWRFELRDGGGRGEKVLAEARTFNNQIFFTSFTPGAGAGGNVNNCQPVLGTNRLYVMDIFNGAPVNNLDGVGDDTTLTEEDRYREFRGSISSEVVFMFPSPDDPNCVGDQCTPPPVACVDLFCFPPGFANNPVRTFWSQESTQ